MEVRRLIFNNITLEPCEIADQSLLHEPHLYERNGHRKLCWGVDGDLVLPDRGDLVVRLRANLSVEEEYTVITVEYSAKISPSFESIRTRLQELGCEFEEEGDYVKIKNIPPLEGYEDMFPNWEISVLKGLEYSYFNVYVRDFYGDFGSRELVIKILEEEGYENPGGLLQWKLDD